ncbi:MAG TPA: type II secretion system protein GspG [Pyrinomonadaceae bacterium]|jgi:hypothetical protein
MSHGKIRKALLFFSLGCCLTGFTASTVYANLSPGQARKAIAHLGGFEMKDSWVRVKSVSATNAAQAEASAEIKAVFKFAQNEQGKWRVAEIRTGQDHWEEIDVIASALKRQVDTSACTAADPPSRRSVPLDPSNKRARCLLGSLFGVETPSDAIRIQDINPMSVPFASQSSAVVVAWVRVDARLLQDKKGWRVTELRTGNNDWVSLDPVFRAVNGEKERKARAEMELIAKALEKFHRERGFYVISDSQAVAIDHLSPRYLAYVIRLDPWHQPYKYQGERDRFTLSSAGPDGKPDTPDDIQVLSPAR